MFIHVHTVYHWHCLGLRAGPWFAAVRCATEHIKELKLVRCHRHVGRPLHKEYDGNQYLQGQGFFFLQGEMVRALNPNNPKPETLSENYLAPLASQLLLSWKPPIRQAWLPCCGSLLTLGQWGWERWPELDPEKAASNSFSHSVRYIFDFGCVEISWLLHTQLKINFKRSTYHIAAWATAGAHLLCSTTSHQPSKVPVKGVYGNGRSMSCSWDGSHKNRTRIGWQDCWNDMTVLIFLEMTYFKFMGSWVLEIIHP